MSAEHHFASTRLCDYRDRALPDDENHRVREHLRECVACRGSLEELTALARQLRSISSAAPDGLAVRVIAHLDAHSTLPRLKIVAADNDRVSPPKAPVVAAWGFAREHLRRTLVLSFIVGVAITLLKDLGTLLAEGITVETCTVCGANFVAAFALLNVWLLLARRRETYLR